jgi:manganese transport protein
MNRKALVEHEGRSLGEVHGSVNVDHPNPLKRLFAFLGPAYLISVGYMDPGNWATDLEGGAKFGYALVWVLLLANLMALLFQTLAARLGVVTGYDLAQGCRAEYSPRINIALWGLAEVAVAATDLAEVLGTVIALKLLFGLPLLWGCLVAAFDTVMLLAIQRLGMRKMEAFILSLVGTIGACFVLQIFFAAPDAGGIVRGIVPSLPPGALYVAAGILGATVMPHNLYLHSALVQSRRIGRDRKAQAEACRYNLIDSAVALNVAFFVNLSILVLSASVFHRNGVTVVSIEDAHRLLPGFLGPMAPVLFALALLCAGQSSTLTGTLAGQIVMEGHLRLRLEPWLQRLITRGLALAPAVAVIAMTGEESTQGLLVLSQVILSLQLSFAVIPLIHFTSSRKNMGEFASTPRLKLAAWMAAAIIVALNCKLILDQTLQALDRLSQSAWTLGRIPAAWVGGTAMFTLLGCALLLLGWITLKPWVSPGPAWAAPPVADIDWLEELRPRTFRNVALALEHGPADADVVRSALAVCAAREAKLVLLHVADGAVSQVYGEQSSDRHTAGDELYLERIESALREKGFSVASMLLHGPDRAERLARYLAGNPVDLLVVGSHRHGAIMDLLVGETVDKVRHRVEIPMLVARPRGQANSSH